MCLSPNVLGISHHEGGGHKNHIWTTTLPPTLAAWQRKPVQVTNYIQSHISPGDPHDQSQPSPSITFFTFSQSPEGDILERVTRQGHVEAVLGWCDVSCSTCSTWSLTPSTVPPLPRAHRLLSSFQRGGNKAQSRRVFHVSVILPTSPSLKMHTGILHMKIPVQRGWTLCCTCEFYMVLLLLLCTVVELLSSQSERHVKDIWKSLLCWHLKERHVEGKNVKNPAGMQEASRQVFRSSPQVLQSTPGATWSPIAAGKTERVLGRSELKKTYWKQTRKHAEIYKLRKAACHIHIAIFYACECLSLVRPNAIAAVVAMITCGLTRTFGIFIGGWMFGCSDVWTFLFCLLCLLLYTLHILNATVMMPWCHDAVQF